MCFVFVVVCCVRWCLVFVVVRCVLFVVYWLLSRFVLLVDCCVVCVVFAVCMNY